MDPGRKALFCHRERLKAIASEKQVFSLTLVFNLFWSFVLDKQSCLSWARDFCNLVITLILTCAVYYSRLWGQTYFEIQCFLTRFFSLSVDTIIIWEPKNTAERLWPLSQMIALMHCEATASTVSSSRVVVPCKGWFSSCSQRADMAGQSNICKHFIGTGQRTLLCATCSSFPNYVIQKLVLIIFRK